MPGEGLPPCGLVPVQRVVTVDEDDGALREGLRAVLAELVDAAGEARFTHPNLLDHGVGGQPSGPGPRSSSDLDHRAGLLRLPIHAIRRMAGLRPPVAC